MFAQLDKCLREALTLDGVLEFRHENIWTLGLSDPSRGSLSALGDHSGFILTGSLHVRIRRDANEQMVLAHVRERLAPLVPLLTVQVRFSKASVCLGVASTTVLICAAL